MKPSTTIGGLTNLSTGLNSLAMGLNSTANNLKGTMTAGLNQMGVGLPNINMPALGIDMVNSSAYMAQMDNFAKLSGYNSAADWFNCYQKSILSAMQVEALKASQTTVSNTAESTHNANVNTASASAGRYVQ